MVQFGAITRGLCGLVASLVLLASVFVGTARAQADADSVFAAYWSEGENWTPPTGVVFRFRHIIFPTHTEQELREWAARLSSTPDHPEHGQLRSEQATLASGGTVAEYQVWWNGPDRHRVNRDYAGYRAPAPINLPAIDCVVAGDVAWTLSPPAEITPEMPFGGQLAVFDTRRPMPEGKNYNSGAEVVDRALRLLVRGERGIRTRDTMSPEDSRWVGSRLIASASNDIVRFSFEGARPLDGLEWRPDSLVVTSSDQIGGNQRHEYRFEGWHRAEIDGLIVATAVEKLRDDGFVLERYEWIDARPLAPGELERVSAIPTPEGEDPIRGTATFTSVFDYRPEAGTFTMQTPDGTRTVPILSTRSAASLSPAWMVAGWIMAGGLVAALVGIRVWRSRRGSSTT